MKCKKIQKLLSDYLDGEVKERERELIEAHLSGCPACREELESYKKAEELIKLKMKEGPAPQFWERCWAEFREKLEKASRTSQPIETGLSPGLRRNIWPQLLKGPAFIGATAGVVILVLTLNLVSLNHKYKELTLFQQELLARAATYPQSEVEEFPQTLVTAQMWEQTEEMEEALSRFPQAELYLEEAVAEILSSQESGYENGV